MQWEQHLSLLPEADNQRFTPALETSADLAIALLTHYSFDLNGYTATELVSHWQEQYPGSWLHLAVVEALYQGRYKGISVQQILTLWQRRGQPVFHFNMEFERLICSKFPQSLTALPALPPSPSPVKKNVIKRFDVEPQKTGGLSVTKPTSRSREENLPPFLPSAGNHPPIKQFSPEKSDGSESFTSKLKAIAREEDGEGNIID
jgi:hypothetical protein